MAPSTMKLVPLTQLAPGLHRKRTTSAISSGSPIRPIGKWDAMVFSNAGRLLTAFCTTGVSTHDGETQLTRMLCLMLSRAAKKVSKTGFLDMGTGKCNGGHLPAVLVKPITACFEATHCTIFGRPMWPTTELMLTITPRETPRAGSDSSIMTGFWDAMTFVAAFNTRNDPCTLTSKVLRSVSRPVSDTSLYSPRT